MYFSAPSTGRSMEKRAEIGESRLILRTTTTRRTESEKRRDRNSVQPWRLTLIAATCYLFVFASSRTDHVCPAIHVPMISACLKEILTRRFGRAFPKNFQDFRTILATLAQQTKLTKLSLYDRYFRSNLGKNFFPPEEEIFVSSFWEGILHNLM